MLSHGSSSPTAKDRNSSFQRLEKVSITSPKMSDSLQSFGNMSSSVYGNATESVSGDDNLLLMCSHDSMDRCYGDYAWKYLIFTLSIVSVVVNAFHLFVLKRLPAICGTSYLFVLQQITVAHGRTLPPTTHDKS